MDTVVYEVKNTKEDQASYEMAGQIIRQGGLVAFPTETVYGLGGDALNPESSRKIYQAKGRPSDNPLIVHIASLDALDRLVEEVPESAKRLADAFWPGPLTMIFRKSKLVPYETTGGLDTVAVRMPSDPVALAFIQAAGGYVAAPSANLSGKPSPTSAKYVAQDMFGRIEMIIDGGEVEIGLESTIVDLTQKPVMILRPGYVTKEMLEEQLGQVALDKTMMDKDTGEAPKAPGMKYRHYAPQGTLVIVEGDHQGVIDYINAQSKQMMSEGEMVGVIATEETKSQYQANVVKSAGNRGKVEMVAHSLYRILREFDDLEVTAIYAESFSQQGMGQAVMNRLLKAAGYRVINLAEMADK